MSALDILLQRSSPTPWDNLMASPLLFFAQLAYAWARPQALATTENPVRVVCLSDTHEWQSELPPIPEGDILIHSGDLTKIGKEQPLREALDWLSAQPHPHKIFIAGNHDKILSDPSERDRIIADYPSLIYLENTPTKVTVRGRDLRIYGSPYTPKFGSWDFQYNPVANPSTYLDSLDSEQNADATKMWATIPEDTDILITHGPPFAHGDFYRDKNVGCYALTCALWRVRPRLHIFGHVHQARGIECLAWDTVQSVYEGICTGILGWDGMGTLMYSAFNPIRGGVKEGKTMLVNAASIGGLKDVERFGATVVDV